MIPHVITSTRKHWHIIRCWQYISGAWRTVRIRAWWVTDNHKLVLLQCRNIPLRNINRISCWSVLYFQFARNARPQILPHLRSGTQSNPTKLLSNEMLWGFHVVNCSWCLWYSSDLYDHDREINNLRKLLCFIIIQLNYRTLQLLEAEQWGGINTNTIRLKLAFSSFAAKNFGRVSGVVCQETPVVREQ